MSIINILFIALIVYLNPLQVNSVMAENGDKPFVILELFTSEGCSSCPPAEKYLSTVKQRAEQNNIRVFPLEFHVDYWDYIGWKDVYAKNEFTQRQRIYANTFQINSIYTPQLVINGLYEFGGYQTDQSEKLIQEFLKQKPSINLDFNISTQKNILKVDYSVNNILPEAIINFALIEKTNVSNVTRGENKGKTLHHSNIVREFQSFALINKSDSITMTIPEDLNTSNAAVIAYIQQNPVSRVLGANSNNL